MILAAACALGAPCLPTSPAVGAPAPRVVQSVDAARWIPADAPLYVEAPGLNGWLAGGLAHPAVAALLAHPLGRLALADATLSPEDALALAEQLTGRPVLPTLARLTARGLAVGVVPGRSATNLARTFLVLAADDAEFVEALLEDAFDVIAARAAFDRRLLDAPHARIDGAAIYRLGDKLALARDGATLVLARTVDDIVRALDAKAGRAPALADDARFGALRDAGSDARFAWSYLDLAGLAAAVPNVRDKLAEFATQPAPHFLLGPVLTHLSRAGTLGVSLDVAGGVVELALDAREVDLGPGAQTFPRTAAPGPLARRAGDALHALVHRDAATITARRAELFPPTAQPAFAKALSDLTPLLAGLDLYEDLLPGVSPWLRIVVRDVAYDAGATPDVALPAVCLVTHLAEPEQMGPSLVASFQSAIGLTSIQAAQQGRPGLALGLALERGVTITRALFPRPRAAKPDEAGAAAAPTPVDLRYNLAPACAVAGGCFVLGTHHALVAEVVNELLDHSSTADERVVAPSTQPDELVQPDELNLHGASLAALVEANRAAFTLDAMLSKGKTRARAEAELDALAALFRSIERARLVTSAPAANRLGVALRLDLTGTERR